jgi:hypothetical protein
MRPIIIGLAAAGALALAPSALAQLIIPTAPNRPNAVLPASGAVLRGERPALTPMTFVWDQPGAIYRPAIDPPPPRAFAICVRAAAASTPCAWPGIWTAVAANVPNKPIRNAQGTVVGYRYTLGPVKSLADQWLDQPIAWTILACANTNGTTCSASAARPLHVSSIDLVASNVSIGDSTTTDLVVKGEAINLGTGGPSTSVRSDLLSLPALLDGMGVCDTDVNNADYANMPGLAAVLGNGTLVPFTWLPRLADGNYDSSNVRAIIRTNDPVLVGDYTLLAAGNLAAGVGRPVETPPLSTSVAAANRPLGVVSILVIDGSGAIVEYDEGNNVKVECKSLN